MSHEAIILEDGDTLYVGTLNDGQLTEVRLANFRGELLITDNHGSHIAPSATPTSCPQCDHYWKSNSPITNCRVGIGGGELCECPGAFHHD